MTTRQTQSGFAPVGRAKLYYEVAGAGDPLVMIHAGVADSRQWNNEFAVFAYHHQVVRYDMRGYGHSEPADGEFSHLGDLTALLEQLGLDGRLVVMGCSMGGGLALNFALARPERVRGLIMVDAGPPGLELDIPAPAKFAAAEAAYNVGDLDQVAELETQIWFDGEGRTPDQVNQAMRKLAYDMNRRALDHEAKQLGKRLPDAESPAVERLGALTMPVLVIVGAHDTPYMLAAADYMVANIPTARKVIIADAAHLPNMDQPAEFSRAVLEFLRRIP
jgi:pimeloyl-ACP methyl ester carboxylesterase